MPKMKLYTGTGWITLDAANADTLGGKLPDAFAPVAHIGQGGQAHALATQSQAGFLSPEDKQKLDGVIPGAGFNQNAFSFIKVGATILEAEVETDTLEIAAGANISITPDATNDKLTFAVTGIANGAEVNQNTFGVVNVHNAAGANKGTLDSDAKRDTLILKEGTGVTMTPDAANDTVTVSVDSSAFATTSHNHDDRYYTETEMNTLLGAKENNLTFAGANGITTARSGNTVTITHTDSSTQASVNNANGNVIQDVTLDTNGHVTGLASINLDNRFVRKDTTTETIASVTISGTTINATTGNTLETTNLNITNLLQSSGLYLSGNANAGVGQQIYGVPGYKGMRVDHNEDVAHFGLLPVSATQTLMYLLGGGSSEEDEMRFSLVLDPSGIGTNSSVYELLRLSRQSGVCTYREIRTNGYPFYFNNSQDTTNFAGMWRDPTNGVIHFVSGAQNHTTPGNTTVRAGAFSTTSARQYKKDITPFEGNALSLINATPIRNYRMKTEADDAALHVGVIVDESPELIHGVEGDSVETYPMTALAWKGIQELTAENQILKAQLAAMEERLAKLESK